MPDTPDAASAEQDTRSVGISARPNLEMLADRPLAADPRDRLGFADYADALAELIDNPATRTPLTLAISAPWGAGKTSLARMVEQRLLSDPPRAGRRPHITCWFDAWAHDDAPHLGSALAADVASTLDPFRGWRRYVSPLPSRMLTARQRLRRRVLFALSFLVAAGILVYFILAGQTAEGSGQLSKSAAPWVGAGATAGLWAVLLGWSEIFPAASSLASFVLDPSSEAARGSMAEVKDQLGRLIDQATRESTLWGETAGPRRLVVFIDDLERCRPARAVDVCEVAHKVMDHPKVVIVFVGDLSVIAAGARMRYREVENYLDKVGVGGADRNRGWQFLQKMIQVRFDLPPCRADSLQRLISTQLATTHDGPGVGRVPKSGSDIAPKTSAADQTPGSGIVRSTLSDWLVRSASSHVGPVVVGLVSTGLAWPWLTTSMALTAGLAAGLLMALAEGAMVSARVRRRARRRRDIDEQIKQQLEVPDPPDLSTLSENLTTASAAGGHDPRLVRLRLRRHLIDDSVLRREAESELLAYLPPLPRSIKRAINQLRLLLAIAINRNLLAQDDGDSILTAAHIGKWVVLNEHWPGLARVIKQDPSRIQQLEELHIETELTTFESQISGTEEITGIDASKQLVDFLRATPQLADVIDRLVYLRPHSL